VPRTHLHVYHGCHGPHYCIVADRRQIIPAMQQCGTWHPWSITSALALMLYQPPGFLRAPSLLDFRHVMTANNAVPAGGGALSPPSTTSAVSIPGAGSRSPIQNPRLLLVSVFGPYGIRSDYEIGDGMQMELLDNQVTRDQGIHSPRVEGTYSYGLYLMARNISVHTVVLDFPSWEDFVAELKNGYTHVGISFIAQNILKVRRMAIFVRRALPDAKIILGGAGASIPDLEHKVPCDEICHGEGIRWLQRYFGEDNTRPIRRCVFSGPQNFYIYGRKIRDISSSVIPGVGCPNGCAFCCTTHKFRKAYIPFIQTGKEMFELLFEEERRFAIHHFTIADENFLKHKKLARELLCEMERCGKAYSFSAFSSAEAVADLGVDFIVRLGINFLWLGVESKYSKLTKLRGVDLKAMIHSLRANGVGVLGSAMLFLDHHDRENIVEDIDWAIGLKTDLAQFVAITPCPGTPLFEEMRAAGRLLDDYPFHKQNGLNRIYYSHPNFHPDETSGFIDGAFRKNFEVNGPGILNLAQTSIEGYKNVREIHERQEMDGWRWDETALAYVRTTTRPVPDRFMKLRLQRMRESAEKYRPLVLTWKCFSPNRAAREKASRLAALCDEVFGRQTMADRGASIVGLGSAGVESLRLFARKAFGRDKVRYQPPLVRREYNVKRTEQDTSETTSSMN
jgi:hypothetical protein